MGFSPILVLHISAGMVGILSGTAAMSFRKGPARHAQAGKVFVIAMLTMAASAVYLALMKHQPNNVGGGILTFYLVGTAWLTARRRDGETSIFDWAALLVPRQSVSVAGSTAWKRCIAPPDQNTGFPLACTSLWVLYAYLLPRETFACWCVAASSAYSVSRGISGACALVCSSPPGRFSWDRAARYFPRLYSKPAYSLSRRFCHCCC